MCEAPKCGNFLSFGKYWNFGPKSKSTPVFKLCACKYVGVRKHIAFIKCLYNCSEKNHFWDCWGYISSFVIHKMGRKDASAPKLQVDQYRKQIGDLFNIFLFKDICDCFKMWTQIIFVWCCCCKILAFIFFLNL